MKPKDLIVSNLDQNGRVGKLLIEKGIITQRSTRLIVEGNACKQHKSYSCECFYSGSGDSWLRLQVQKSEVIQTKMWNAKNFRIP